MIHIVYVQGYDENNEVGIDFNQQKGFFYSYADATAFAFGKHFKVPENVPHACIFIEKRNKSGMLVDLIKVRNIK